MKYIIKTGFLTLVLAVILSACNKVGPLQLFGSGTPVTLIPSSTEINPAPGDSNKIVAFLRGMIQIMLQLLLIKNSP